MAPLLQSDVHQVFNVWVIMFPSKLTDQQKQVEILERSYFVTLAKRLSREEFFLCAEKAQTETMWFPKIAEILKYRDEAIRDLARKRNLKALPEDHRTRMSDEEAAAGLENYRKAVELAKSGLSHEEMAAEMEKFIQERAGKAST